MAESVPAPKDPASPDTPFAGQPANDTELSDVPAHERYVPLRMLGQGAMGAVHLVRDRETGEQLALKKLLRMDVRSVLRLKREFRSLADMRHANLVKVYELGQAPDACFVVMEYVPGEDLQAYLGTGRASVTGSRIEAAVSQVTEYRAWLEEALVPAFHQLASGVAALHCSRARRVCRARVTRACRPRLMRRRARHSSVDSWSCPPSGRCCAKRNRDARASCTCAVCLERARLPSSSTSSIAWRPSERCSAGPTRSCCAAAATSARRCRSRHWMG